MPGEEVDRSLSLLHLTKEVACPILTVSKRGAAYLEVREAGLEVLCGDLVKIEELRLSATPGALVRAIVGIEIGLVPDLPILDLHLHSVAPSLSIVADDMLADDRPLMKILRGQSVVFLLPMLDLRAETEERLAAAVCDDLHILVGQHEIVGCGIVRICIEIRKDIVYVNRVLSAIGCAESRIVRARIRNSRLAPRLDVGYSLVNSKLIDRSVVDRVHRLYLAAGVLEIDSDLIHYLFLPCVYLKYHI